MTKILFFISNFHQKELTGQQKIGFGLAEKLKSRGYALSIITNSITQEKTDVIEYSGIKCLVIAGKADIFNFARNIFRMIKFTKKTKPDIIHGNGLASVPLTLLLSKIFRLYLIQTIYDIVGFSQAKRNFYAFCLRFADLIFTSSFYIKNILIGYKVDSEKIKLIYYGIEEKWFEDAKENEDKSLRLLFWGDAKSDRGIDTILEFINSKHKELSKIADLNYIFAIRYSEDHYKNILADMAKKFPFKIIYDTSDIKQLVENCDIIVLPYKSTTLQPPLTLIESMLSAKIVIASNIHSNGEFVKDGHSGFLLKQNNAQELYTILKNILSSPNELKNVSSNARESALEKYDIEKNIKNIITEYNYILRED